MECQCLGVHTIDSELTLRIPNRDTAKLVKPLVMRVKRTGKPGRPRKEPSMSWLNEALSPSRRLTFKQIAKLCGISVNTLRFYLKRHGVYQRFSNITNDDLDILIKAFKGKKPSSGLSYVIGFLRGHGIRIQKERVRLSMRRIDGLGQVLRNHQAIDRQQYSVPRSNYLWHLDGHHKLIQWGIVIHGIVDGHCRSVGDSLMIVMVGAELFYRLSVSERVQTIKQALS
jgi:hypothetical protein